VGGFVRARRTRIRGLPQSPAVIRSVPRPFVRGKNTDVPSWALDPQEMPDGTDIIFPKGVAAPRGPYISASASGVLIASGSGWLSGGMAVDLPSYGAAGTQPATPVLVAATQNGIIGMVQAATPNGTMGTVTIIAGAQAILPREVYKGEVLFCPQDGLTPVYRCPGAPAGSLTSNSASAGTLSLFQGTSFVLGIGTTFTTQARVGTYLVLGGFPGASRLVLATDDNTHLSVDGIFPITTGVGNLVTVPGAGAAWGTGTPSRIGTIGLCTPVQTLGQTSLTAATATVNGFGTLWNTANTPPGHGRPVAGLDYFGWKGGYDRLAAISSITNDYTIVLTAADPNGWANKPYIIYRPAVGRECRYHQGRLYITGVAWDPTGVYYLPVNSPLGAFYNPDTAATVVSDYATSQCLVKFDVPIQGAQGQNVALLSTPQGLLVLRTDNAYLSMGDPPTNTVIEIAHGAGCVDIRSACVGNRGEGAFWAGPNGIYRYVGGRVIDLTEGRRNREWRQKMSSFLVDYVFGGTAAYVSCGVQDSHLFVSVYDSANGALNSLWVYDLIANAWCGDFSGLSVGISSMSMYRSTTMAAGQSDDLYFTIGGTTSGVDRSQLMRMGGIVRDEGGLGTSALHGTFSADLPESMVGPPDDLSRVIEAKVVYELTGGDGTTKLRLASSVDGGALGTDTDLAVNATGPQEQRVMPVSDVTTPPAGSLGLLGRRHGHRLSQVGTKPSALRVHQIDLVVRPRRPRA
jgi:hypothetical protein